MIKRQDPAMFNVSLKVLLTNKKGQHLVLFVNNPRSKIWHGKYDFAGGRINNDEINSPFHELLDREIKEEIGEDVKYSLRKDPVAMSMCQYPGESKKLFILFEAKYHSGEIQLSDEHYDYTWTSITPKIIKEKFPSVLRDLMRNYLRWNKK